MKPAKNLATYAVFLAVAVAPAFFVLACEDQKPPMTPDSFAMDDSGATPSLPSTDGLPTSMPALPSASSLMTAPK